MSFLTPSSSEPTLAEKQASIAAQIRRVAAEQYTAMLGWQHAGIIYVWENRGLSPQQVCDALGTEAVKVFDLHAKLTQTVIELAQIGGVQPEIKLPAFAFTRNSDGTVTVLNTPYVR